VDNELSALLNEKFSEANGRFDRLETEIRHAGVKIAALRDAVQQNNELTHGVDEKLDRFHIETLDELKDIRTDIRISFSMLGRRITDLENSHS
jgi:archaellum component FlaC